MLILILLYSDFCLIKFGVKLGFDDEKERMGVENEEVNVVKH